MSEETKKCPDCKAVMTIWCKDLFDYETGIQHRDIPHWYCVNCAKWFPYVDEVE